MHIGLKNHRNGDLHEISFRPPADLAWVPQPTSLEAQNLCATYALHRVSSMQNTKSMLPPAHKDFWALFEDIRLRDTQAGRAWMYEADPFIVEREHEALEAIELERKKTRDVRPADRSPFRPASVRKERGWVQAPVVDMATELRKEAERLIRRLHVWNPHRVVLDDAQRAGIVSELVDLGFQRAHVLEACDRVKDAAEAVEWLLVHLPEGDVPSQFLPECYQSGITGGTSAATAAAAATWPERAARRLAAAGYSLDLCRQVLAQNDSDEDRAAEALMHMQIAEEKGDAAAAARVMEDAQCEQFWVEELGAVESVFASDRLTHLSATSFQIDLKLQLREKDEAIVENPILRVRKPTGHLPGAKPYPYSIPTLELLAESERKFPAHVRLNIVKQAAAFALGMRGDYMLLALIDWLETEIPSIAANLGRLTNLDGVVDAAATGRGAGAVRNRRRNKGRQNKTAGPIDWTPGTPKSMRILEAAHARLETPAQKRMMEAREGLPAWCSREAIVGAVNSAQVAIIR